MPPSKLPTAYKTLFQQVQQTLALGQQRIEAEKVKIYWETGNLIHAHIKQHKDRAEYGARVVKQLAQDLRMEPTVLHRCVKFAQKYSRSQIVAARQQFSWSHYRKLIAVPDDQKRLLLENSARRHQWSSRELEARIESVKEQPVGTEDEEGSGQAPSATLLIPKRGEPYTYRIIRRPALGNNEEALELLLDLGFGVFKDLDTRTAARFSPDQIVESHKKKDIYSIAGSGRGVKDLFTYRAFIEKVIDADTLKVRVDLGFGIRNRQVLRLRGIDAPELGTKSGDAARALVQSLLKEASAIELCSTRPDKYGRYLADVFIPAENGGEDLFLNNVLLEKGHARRM